MVKCPHCGTENIGSSKFCQNCGQEITLKPDYNEEVSDKPSTLLIVLGYILALLGIFSAGILSVIGLIIGIVLYRKGGSGKTHGLIIMIISILILLVAIVGIFFLLVYRAYFYTPV